LYDIALQSTHDIYYNSIYTSFFSDIIHNRLCDATILVIEDMCKRVSDDATPEQIYKRWNNSGHPVRDALITNSIYLRVQDLSE